MAKELRIRNFPEELLKTLRVDAAKRGISLRKLVIERLTPIKIKRIANPIPFDPDNPGVQLIETITKKQLLDRYPGGREG